MSSVWVEMPFMRGPAGAERLRQWLPTARQNREAAANRRARVLAHPWASKRLCLILELDDARKWNGFVPPARDPEGQPNQHPSRRELIELLRDVATADQGDSDPTETE